MNDYRRTIEVRFSYIVVFIICMTVLLFWRMVDIQIIKHKSYLKVAADQQRLVKKEMAERGKILVHDSPVDPKAYYPLAFDLKKYAVWVVPNQVNNKKQTAEDLAVLLGISKDDIFNKINNEKMWIPSLKNGLNFDEADLIKNKDLSGVYVTPEYSRYYPESALASQVLGFVNAEGDGKYGFEGHYDNELKGKDGQSDIEKDTLGRIINLLDKQDPQNGTSYVLTIDRSVQYYVEKKLAEALIAYGAESGTVIVMDVKTGGIISMASLPTFDPNNFRDQAKNDPSLFMNPAISYLFEPGSIFKPIAIAAAIDSGLVTADTKGVYDSVINIGGYDIHTAEGKAFGEETMTQVLENSDNVAMAALSQKMDKNLLYKYVKSFNFLDKTGIDLDTEVSGRAPDLKQWRDINKATISFGQGISVTPIEMVAAYAAIANNGRYVYPHMIDKMIMSDGTEKKVEKQEGEQIITQATAKSLQQMLYSVVINGHSKKAGVAGFKVAAKTGTAQIPKADGGYEASDDYLGIYNHSEAGFAPVDNPQFAMLVKLTKPKTVKYAESSAAPLFGDIASFLLNYHYRITPTEPIK